MTREQILAMPAGREIDRLIGEHVFGHDPAEMNETWVLMRPRYSGDMNAAWLVVEAIRTEKPKLDRVSDAGPWFSIDAPDCDEPNGKWQAGFRDRIQYEGEGMCFDTNAVAETAPLAICRAALLAKLNTEGKS